MFLKFLDFIIENYYHFENIYELIFENIDLFFEKALKVENDEISKKIKHYYNSYIWNKSLYDYKQTKTEKELINWYYILEKIWDLYLINKFFNFWIEKYWETKEYKHIFNIFLKNKDKIQENSIKVKNKIEKQKNLFLFEYYLNKWNLEKAKSLLKNAILLDPYDDKLYKNYDLLRNLYLKNLQDEFWKRYFYEELGKYLKDIKDKKNFEIFIKNTKDNDIKIRIVNYLIENNIFEKSYLEKIKQKIIKDYVNENIKNDQKNFKFQINILNRLIQTKRLDRLIWDLQYAFNYFDLADKKKLKKVVIKIKEITGDRIRKDILNINLDDYFMKFTRLKDKDLLFFYEKLWWFIKAQVNISLWLQILYMQSKSLAVKNLSKSIIDWIKSWKKISEVMASFKEIPKRDIALIKVGEEVGWFEYVFDSLKEYYQDTIYRKKKIKSMMIYPTITILVWILVLIAMLIYVFPKFVEIFKQFNAPLPFITQFFISLSDILRNYYIYLITLFLIVFVSLFLFFKTTTWYVVKSFLFLHLPVISQIHKRLEVINFLQTYYLLLKWGVNITTLFDFLIESSNNYFFQRELKLAKELIVTWDTISKALGLWENIASFKSVLLPVEIVYAIKVWEETWKLEEVLRNLIYNYKEDFKIFVNNLQQLIEPFLILFIWWLAFMLILSIFLPMINLYRILYSQIKI